MDYFLSKLLPLFIYPLGLALLLVCLALPAVAGNRKRTAVALLASSVAILWLASMSVSSAFLLRTLQGGFLPRLAASYSEADVIVVLGGVVNAPKEAAQDYNLSRSADRLLHARRLYRAGKAPWIIVSGGGSEGRVPAAAIVREAKSRNTRQNAMLTKVIMEQRGFHRILLVTSAFHMKRALATFRAVGIEVIPAPTDFEASAKEFAVLQWLPDAEALFQATYALKEYIGIVVYRLRGWAE
jgi:uncharacterized SAM-binding protein YcdF (DUF218 family)